MEVMQEITEAIKKACKDLFNVEVEPELTRPEEQFGDYSTNIALQLAGKLNRSPREIAIAVASKLHGQNGIAEVNIAGPGFINLKLTDEALLKTLDKKPTKQYAGQTVVAEYSDPSAFKILHAGHLYTSVVGDAIANLLENAGGRVHRVNFGGDIGRHVAITMWAILKELGGENKEKLLDIPKNERAHWMSARYVEGNTAFEDDEQVKSKVAELNKRLYQLHEQNDRESAFAQIYWTCRTWSYDYFDQFYARIGSHFEKYYPESEVADLGIKTVKEHLGQVYKESDGAIVFDGEKYGLHTRVFINSAGLPTYEAKDVGLIMQKWADYAYDFSVIITDNAQLQYLEVVLKSISQFEPKLTERTRHLTHGRVKLPGNVKMSSRKGNIVTAENVLDLAQQANKEINNQDNENTALAAVKYAFLKNRIGGDIIYDPAESVALEGNSGPYLQYAHARARSILEKSQVPNSKIQIPDLDKNERSLARKIGEYAEVVEKATAELMPHHVCTYLYELAQTFNRFYEQSRVIGDERQEIRLNLVGVYADVLKNGLNLLGISAPDKM